MEKEELERRKKVLLDLMNDKQYVPMKIKELAILLDVPKDRRAELKEVLDSLLSEGRLSVSKKGKYAKPEASSLIGTYSGTQKGFGFVTIEGMENDVYIGEEFSGGALHGDLVQIVITRDKDGSRRAEGRVVKVVKHEQNEIIGTYEECGHYGFVIPDNQKISKDIFVAQGRNAGAVTGHKVIVKLTDYGNERKNPEGYVSEILGHVNDPGTDILSIIRGYELPVEFPEVVMEQVEGIPERVSDQEYADRLDLRAAQTVTIDGEDAKDLDDAITLEKEGGIYRLGVHIADVTHYVKENSPLDREALKRGTSVYLVDRVIPMLPHKLSNGICSLNAGEDRLALSCLMDIDEKGTVLGHRIAETVIRVDRRMSYTSVKKILEDQDPDERKEYEELIPMFERMEELAGILRIRRKKRGAVDFDFPETKILLNKEGKPLDIRPYERNTATDIIEDFMLAANETIAEDFYWQEQPFLYRIHEVPDMEKIQKLTVLINNFGYSLRTQGSEIHPKELQKLLVKIQDSPEEALIARLTLRSMKQAKYSPVCAGHFGLAANYYCHFTSPIRRYPDLQIHRIIKENLAGKLGGSRAEHYTEILPEVAVQCSQTERRADEAERETLKVKKVEYMAGHIGERYEGVISGVTGFGFYVELPNTVEGFVHVNTLNDDYYHYDEAHYGLVGEDRGKRYKLGQKIRVTVADVDRLLRRIDFMPVYEEDEEECPRTVLN